MAGATTATDRPVPERLEVTGLVPPPLKATLSVVDREPIAVGLKFIRMVQFVLGASVVVQLPPPVFTKSPVLPPTFVIVMPVSVDPVVFESVKGNAALDDPTFIDPKFWLVGVSVTVPGFSPVPERAEVTGLVPPPLKATLSVVDRGPTAVGLNSIWIVQLLPVVSVVVQLPPPVFTKSPVLPPTFVTVMPVSVDPVVFESVKVNAALDDPTAIDPKLWLVGFNVTVAVIWKAPRLLVRVLPRGSTLNGDPSVVHAAVSNVRP